MPDAASFELRGIVQGWNVYASTDPFLDSMDSARLGPDDRLLEPNAQATREAISAARELNIATPEAIDALQDTQRALALSGRANERSSAFRLEGLRNFAREVVRVAVVASKASARGLNHAFVGAKKVLGNMLDKYSEEAAKQLGKRTIDALYWSGLAWVSTQLAWLTALFGPGSAMRQILDQLAKLLL
ncbi:hypothetical protein [Reyranella sp.]|uniref:hypothetical protein n=1 Tax=Reyranella sp. TaxID=1929291 RepID=UPI003C7BC891